MALLLLAACSGGGEEPPPPDGDGPTGPQDYTVLMDVPDPDRTNLEFTSFFPGTVKVRPGDSVTFRNENDIAPHTVTFGVEPNRSNQPPWDPTPAGFSLPNPAVEGNCVAPEPPTPDLRECPEPVAFSFDDFPPYEGAGYWNSGLVLQEVRLPVGPDIEPGAYPFVCLLHPDMGGTLQVVAEDALRDEPAEVLAQAQEQQRAVVQATGGEVPGRALAAGQVAVGWSQPGVLVNRFQPTSLTVPAGFTVEWLFTYVHSVTFQGAELDPRGGDFPTGSPSGSTFQPGAHSGYVFETSEPPSFSLTFTEPGTYAYSCIPHPGMNGSITVTG